MNKKTKEALEGSIQKWVEIVKGTGIDNGTWDCPLCTLFMKHLIFSHPDDCFKCPVKEKTGKKSCGETPYAQWEKHHGRNHVLAPRKNIQCPLCKTLAKKELKFLRSLRVKEKSNVRPE